MECLPGERVVQAWRAKNWPPGTYSMVSFALKAEGKRTRVTLDHTGFPKVFSGEDQGFDAGGAGGEGHGQGSTHRPDGAFEPQLTEDRDPFQALCRHLLSRRQDPQRDGQVEG